MPNRITTILRRLTHPQPHPIPHLEPYTTEPQDLPDSKLERLNRRRIGIGQRLEVNKPARQMLGTLVPAITHSIPGHDPHPHHELLGVVASSPPALWPHLRAHLDELTASTPSHKWNRLWRINDFRHAIDRAAGEG